jgi:SAM-dependent methyltransferase
MRGSASGAGVPDPSMGVVAGGGRERLRGTFDQSAECYEQARPSYPDRLFDDLVEIARLGEGDQLLEIGCGSGKATRPMLGRGFRVVCVELGAQLATVARREPAGLPAQVHQGSFEAFDAPPSTFALVYAATAWHWLDPEIRYRQAHTLLRPQGHLAFWSALHAFPDGFDPFFTEIQSVYQAIREGGDLSWPPPRPDEIADDSAEITASGLFEAVQVHRYVWEQAYTADAYLALLDTFSGHIAMEPGMRNHLYDEIRRRINSRADPRVRRHWYSILHVAQRA